MPHAQLTESVRRLVAQTFGAGPADPSGLRETILVCDGAYCGRRFETSGGHAVWFVEENQVKFYRPDGAVSEVVAVGALPIGNIRAAA